MDKMLQEIQDQLTAFREETNKRFDRLERKLSDHRDTSVRQHLNILEEVGHLNKKFTKLSESQEGLGKRFSQLRIISE